MSRLQELIQELCPEGVEYKKLGEVCEILDYKRKPVSKSKRNLGVYPYYGAMAFKITLMTFCLMEFLFL